MIIGIILEGIQDQAIVEMLCERLGIRPLIRVADGNGKILSRKSRAYAQMLVRAGIDKLIVIKDCNHRPIQQIISRILQNLSDYRPLLCLIPNSIEAWLISQLYPDPERIQDPYQALVRSLGGQHPTIAKLRELAAQLDLGLLSSSCPSFSKFRSFLEDPGPDPSSIEALDVH